MTIAIEDYIGVYLSIILLTLKDITLLLYHLLLKLVVIANVLLVNCNISSDVTSFDINCLDYDINYTITVIPISVCETLTGERQSVSCLSKKCMLNNLLKFM